MGEGTEDHAAMGQGAQGFGQQGNAATAGDQAEDSETAFGGLKDAGAETGDFARARDFPGGARIGVFGDGDEEVARQGGEGDAGFAGGGVPRREDRHPLANADAAFGQTGGVRLVREAEEAGVEPAFADGPGLGGGRVVEEVDGHLRVGVAEAGQDFRHQGMEQAPDVAEVEFAAAALAALGGAHGLFAALEHGPGLGQKGAAGGGEGDVAAVAFEEADAEFVLELTDLTAEGGLRHAQAGGGLGEVQAVRDRREVAQVTQFHAAMITEEHDSANHEVLAGGGGQPVGWGTADNNDADMTTYPPTQAAPRAERSWETRFARRTQQMRRSAVRELLKLTHRADMISLAGGLPAPELFPVEAVRVAAERVLAGRANRALQYGETEGEAELRDWVARHYAAEGIEVDRRQVLITTGSQQALDLLGRVLLNPGDAVAVENPTYLALLSAWRPLGVRFEALASDAEGVVPEALEAYGSTAPKLVYLVPDFQNPRGTTLPASRRRRVLAWLRERQTTLVEDTPYRELRYEGGPEPRFAGLQAEAGEAVDDGMVISTGSFSKVLMPGLRVGWVVAPTPVIEKLVMAKQAADLHTSTFSQHLVIELLRQGVLEAQLPRLRAAYRERRDAMLAALERHMPPGTAWTRPAGGFFLELTLPDGLDAATLLAEALEQGVAFVPGQEFHLDGEGANRLRLNFSHAAPERIEEGIRRLAEGVRRAVAAGAG